MQSVLFIVHRDTETQSHRVTESQSHRVTESQTPKGTQCTANLCEYFVSIHGQHKICGIRDASSSIFLDHN